MPGPFTASGLLPYACIGFLGQMVGSSMGMGYGVTSTSILLAMGVPPAVSSVSVHSSEVVNRLLSGLSHYRYGNVDPGLFKKLAAGGVAGALAGALIVTSLPVKVLVPGISCFLILMGVRILLMGLGKAASVAKPIPLLPLGVAGGVVDVIGGGGWGPMVTATLMLRGTAGRVTVGSVNFAKFFVALAESASLFLLLRSPDWTVILGMIAGGAVAAPIAAAMCSRISPRIMMLFIGTLICALSVRTIFRALA
ncbi:sulfite exporter TauE/SafE family protein [Geomonas sp. Red69]|uniref:sulfite exporter TauE/SafE family protein n=1 Tax=Geomonas diazotrophica TaxID=2843197 RepID=UPI001C101806|nr:MULTISPECIES: sulfite exporter TauE/SafE family protein [Geomonas]MBU5636070.1 sulfite exporter TauE/SafE family protein [Geomonas diazotrophica]QXE85039.1 sulfite exporter TauE/SafE family protein [Geomonas nitrogeniifigens]